MLLALGVASLFNHSRDPNLNYRVDKEQKARAQLFCQPGLPKFLLTGCKLLVDHHIHCCQANRGR